MDRGGGEAGCAINLILYVCVCKERKLKRRLGVSSGVRIVECRRERRGLTEEGNVVCILRTVKWLRCWCRKREREFDGC